MRVHLELRHGGEALLTETTVKREFAYDDIENTCPRDVRAVVPWVFAIIISVHIFNEAGTLENDRKRSGRSMQHLPSTLVKAVSLAPWKSGGWLTLSLYCCFLGNLFFFSS